MIPLLARNFPSVPPFSVEPRESAPAFIFVHMTDRPETEPPLSLLLPRFNLLSLRARRETNFAVNAMDRAMMGNRVVSLGEKETASIIQGRGESGGCTGCHGYFGLVNGSWLDPIVNAGSPQKIRGRPLQALSRVRKRRDSWPCIVLQCSTYALILKSFWYRLIDLVLLSELGPSIAQDRICS